MHYCPKQFTYFATQSGGTDFLTHIKKNKKTKVDVLSFAHIQCKQYLLSATRQIQGLLEVPLLKKGPNSGLKAVPLTELHHRGLEHQSHFVCL